MLNGRLSIVSVLIALVGCTPPSLFRASTEAEGGALFSDPKVPPFSGVATLVIFREYGTDAFNVPFFVNGTQAVELGRSTYTYVYIQAGVASVRYGSVDNDTVAANVFFNAVGGETYYLKQVSAESMVFPLLFAGGLYGITRSKHYFGFLESTEAKRQLAECRYVQPRIQLIARPTLLAPKPKALPGFRFMPVE